MGRRRERRGGPGGGEGRRGHSEEERMKLDSDTSGEHGDVTVGGGGGVR